MKASLLALLPTILLGLSACSTSIPGGQSSTVLTTETSTTFLDTFEATARVTAIDTTTRKVKLTLEDGKHMTVKCGPEVVNFKQIQIDDVVKVRLTEELSAYLDKGGRMGTSGDVSGELAAVGAKPGAAIADTLAETLKITAIDRNKREVTFVDHEGSKHTTAVRGHINLAKVKVGDRVTVRHTQAIAVSVERS